MPGRTIVNILPETVAKLAEIDNIIGIKEACGSLEQISDVIRMCPKDFIVLSGDDFTAMPTILIGGQGVISVVSNVEPLKMAKLMEASLEGNWQEANTLHYELFPLMKTMFCSPSPGPAKKGLELLGKIDGFSRLPIPPLNEAALAKLKDAMKGLSLI